MMKDEISEAIEEGARAGEHDNFNTYLLNFCLEYLKLSLAYFVKRSS